jgi:hypothetical protein
MAAVLVNAYNVHRTRAEFRETLDRLRGYHIPLEELKAEQVYRGRGAWARVGHVRHEMFREHLQWLARRSHRIAISVIDNGRFFDRNDNGNPMARQLVAPYVAAAMHIALVIQRRNRNQRKNKGKTVLIFDEQSEFESVVEDLIGDPPEFTDGFSGGDETDRLDQIVDTAYFVKSHYSYLIQIADTVAFVARLFLELAIYGHPESYDGERERIEGWFNMVRGNLIGRAEMYPRRGGEIGRFLADIAPDDMPVWA